jgi:hypothetical protein
VSRASRPTLDLDGEWRFVADSERLYRADTLPEGESIHVPGCWESQVARPYRIVTAWYHRTFRLPADWSDDGRLLLRFGAVMYRCAVYLNGRHIGAHEGGYTPFVLEAQSAARWGEENELAVEVVNPLNAIVDYPAFSVERVLLAQEFEPDLPLSQAPHGKQTWYSSQSGLWQSVRLEWVPDLWIDSLRVLPDAAGGRASIQWTIGGEPVGQQEMALRLLDPDGDEVTRATVALEGRSAGEVSLSVPDARLWDIGQPNLYRLEARLPADGGGAHDELVERFGMRDVSVADGNILLNGRPIYMLGALDQDLYPDTISTPPSREYLDEQMRLTRELGINLLRCHIKVPDPAYLEAADDAGILVWCELPNWSNFTLNAARRGRQTLKDMVAALSNHPSIVIWTIINEDWGTRLRYEARDRYWLRNMYDWLRELDPTRLVVDNSACETPETPNFHVKTDLADFHIYFAIPDNAIRWKNSIADFARRPSWLWSPHGDATQTGEEPLVLSEFGNWGLPRLDRLVEHHRGHEPWWFGTGQGYYRPTGIGRRFRTYGLDRIWPDVNALAEATQWHEYDALQYEIGQLRRHDSIKGYVVTELTDAYWEANGMLDAARGKKVFHDRMKWLNAPDFVFVDLDRRDVCGHEQIEGDVYLSSYGVPPDDLRGGRVDWELLVDGGEERRGSIAVDEWPAYRSRTVGRLKLSVPVVDGVRDARLILRAFDGSGKHRAEDELRLAVLSPSARRTNEPLRVAVHDPENVWSVARRLEALGHEIVTPRDADLLVTTEVDGQAVDHADNGGRVLVLVRSRDAVPAESELARRVAVHLRRLPHEGWPGQRSPWDGDWVTSFSWILPGALTNLPDRNPLDFAYAEVLPDHVLLGYDPVNHAEEVTAGMFVGWIHAPAATLWTFRQGRGAVTLTTFRVAPEDGPVASAMLEALVANAATAERRSVDREPVETLKAS